MASTHLVRNGHLERLRTPTCKDLLTLYSKLRWASQALEVLFLNCYSSSPTCTRTCCSRSRSTRSTSRSIPRAGVPGIWLKVLQEVVFLAGAPAPPWTVLPAPWPAAPRTAHRALASQDRYRRQDDQRMLKYTMHEVQSRAGALSPAHQVHMVE